MVVSGSIGNRISSSSLGENAVSERDDDKSMLDDLSSVGAFFGWFF
jgi:hypothetical protein